MNVYPIKVKLNDKEETLTLRLDVDGIRALQNQYGVDINDLILDCGSNPVKMADVLSAALGHRNNKNTVLSGDEVFMALADDNRGGMIGWSDLAMRIAVVSGTMTVQQVEKILEKMKRAEEQALSDEVQEETPTKAAKQ